MIVITRQSFPVPDERYARTKIALLHLIAQKAEEGEDRLPPEDELARQLGVSRMLIRDVFGELESRGYIARKRGKGTSINRQICQAKPRIDEQISFTDLIEAKGMSPTVVLLDECWVSPQEADLPPEAGLRSAEGPLLMMERTFCGDGQPLIHSKVYFRGDNFTVDYKSWSQYGDLSLSEFLEAFCIRRATVTLAELDLCPVDAALADKLKVTPETVLFRMTDIRFDFDGHEIVRGRAIFCPQVLPLKLVRHED